jgi:hypothetical protein
MVHAHIFDIHNAGDNNIKMIHVYECVCVYICVYVYVCMCVYACKCLNMVMDVAAQVHGCLASIHDVYMYMYIG